MHKLNSYILIVLCCLVVSCDNDILTKNPPDQLSGATFWKTENDLKKGLAGCYSWLSPSGAYATQTAGFGALSLSWSTLSDNAYGDFQNIARGEIEPSSGGIIYNAYNNYYQAIATCNTFVDKAPDVDLPPEQMNRYLSEARFIRAYYYFRLTELYGGVPLLLDPVAYDKIEQAVVTQSSKEEVTKAILEDLNFAIKNLPDDLYVSHVVKGSAEALKTRVLLYNQRWQEAANTAKQIIDSGTFELADSYKGLFLKPTQQNNPEIMFSARYQLPNVYSALDYAYGGTPLESVQPIQNLIDAYECTDGNTIENSPLYDPDNPYKNRDPRLKMTNFVPGAEVPYGNGVFEPSEDARNETGFLVKKYIDPSRAPYTHSTRSDQDWVILRYAEVLLDYAEAKNEVSGPDKSVYTAINKIRQRPDVDMPLLPTNLSQSQMRQRIRHERRIELALEGQRYFDLKRWKIADQLIPRIKDPGGDFREFDEHNYLWPFPLEAINKNKKLEQNPGY